MSMAIARSKYTGDRMNYMGDPGLFSFLGKVAKTGLGLATMLPGVGGIARTLSGAIFPPAPGTTTYAQMPPMGIVPGRPQAGPGSVPVQPLARRADFGSQASFALARAQGVTCPPGRTLIGKQCVDFSAALPGGIPLTVPAIAAEEGMAGAGFQATTAMMAGKPTGFPGYHWNKSGYFLMTGEYIAPGTKAVRNRRRNPANPRATSNAITRIKGAKRYAKSLSSISIRKKC